MKLDPAPLQRALTHAQTHIQALDWKTRGLLWLIGLSLWLALALALGLLWPYALPFAWFFRLTLLWLIALLIVTEFSLRIS